MCAGHRKPKSKSRWRAFCSRSYRVSLWQSILSNRVAIQRVSPANYTYHQIDFHGQHVMVPCVTKDHRSSFRLIRLRMNKNYYFKKTWSNFRMILITFRTLFVLMTFKKSIRFLQLATIINRSPSELVFRHSIDPCSCLCCCYYCDHYCLVAQKMSLWTQTIQILPWKGVAVVPNILQLFICIFHAIFWHIWKGWSAVRKMQILSTARLGNCVYLGIFHFIQAHIVCSLSYDLDSSLFA